MEKLSKTVRSNLSMQIPMVKREARQKIPRVSNPLRTHRRSTKKAVNLKSECGKRGMAGTCRAGLCVSKKKLCGLRGFSESMLLLEFRGVCVKIARAHLLRSFLLGLTIACGHMACFVLAVLTWPCSHSEDQMDQRCADHLQTRARSTQHAVPPKHM